MKHLKQKIVIGVVLFVPVVASAADLNLSAIKVDLGEHCTISLRKIEIEASFVTN